MFWRNQIRQVDNKDCGPICIKMIMEYYGKKVSLQKIREEANTTQYGTTVRGLQSSANKYGFVTNVMKGEIEDLIDEVIVKNITLPMVLHLKNNHFIILKKIKKGRVYIYDPQYGNKILSKEQVLNVWSGYAIEVKKGDDFKKKELTNNKKISLWGIIIENLKYLVPTIILSIVIAMISLLGTFVFKYILDIYNTNIQTQQVIEHLHIHENIVDKFYAFLLAKDISIFFGVVIFLYCMQAIMTFIRSLISALLSQKFDLVLTKKYFAHIIRVPIKIYESRMKGEYISRLSDISAIRNAISHSVTTCFFDGVIIIVGSYFLYYLNKEMLRYSVILICFFCLIIMIYKNIIKTVYSSILEENSKLQSIFKQVLDGMMTMKLCDGYEYIEKKLFSKLLYLEKKAFRGNVILASQNLILNIIESVCGTIILWKGFNEVLQENMTMGSLVTGYMLISYILSPIKNLVELQPEIQKAMNAVERINDILEMRLEEKQRKKDISLIKDVSIDFDKFDFSYNGDTILFNGGNIKFQKGDKVCIIGQNGSGKSTIAKVLVGLYDAKGLKINNIDIKKENKYLLCNSIFYIEHNAFFFADTIRNNIMLGMDYEGGEDKLNDILEMCKLTEFVKKQDFGIDTMLEENGNNLSTGQKQRIALARALIREPEVLILDEATSNMDTESEEIFWSVIRSYKNMTCIIITHDKKIMGNCNKVYYISEGFVRKK